MLRLSKKTDYALIALKNLASSPPGTSSSAREIAARYDIVHGQGSAEARQGRAARVASGDARGLSAWPSGADISIADVIQTIADP